MHDKTFRVFGDVRDPATGQPAGGLVVRAFDSDFFRDQPLGESVSGPDGSYDIRFSRDDFTGPLIRLEKHPDLFIRVFDPTGRLVATTEDEVVANAGVETRIDVRAAGASPGGEGLQPEPKPEPKPEPEPTHGHHDGRVREIFSYIHGQPVRLNLAQRLTPAELVQAYRFVRGREKEAPELAVHALPGLFRPSPHHDDCGEGRHEVIRQLLRERGVFDADVGDADDLPAGATVHWFYTEHIRVKYTTDAAFPDDGVNPAVPAADANVTLSDGTVIGQVRAALADLHPDNTEVAPTYVQRVGIVAENALSHYISPQYGMRDPRNGAPRMEYRIRQQDPGIAGQTTAAWSHVEVGPANSDLQNIHTVSHELFHQVQYRYNATTTRSGIYGALREGGARLIEDCINDMPNRYAAQGAEILNSPPQSLIDFPVGTSTPIRYAAGLFWKYIAEHHSEHTGAADEPAVGIDAYRKVLEASATVLPGDPGIGYDPASLRTARANMPWYGSFDEFGWYDAGHTELGSNESTWGNYLVANYLHGTASPVPESRFEYREDDEAITWPGAGVATLAALQAAVLAGDAIALAQGTNVTRNVAGQKAYSARYYRVTPSGAPAPRLLRVTFTASAGMTDPMVQILRLGAGNVLVDLHRSDAATWTKTVAMDGLASVVVIASARVHPGDFSVQFEEIASATDVMVTRWNSAVGTEYEADPRGWAWTWVSPDVMVDTDDDLLADGSVYFGVDNKLKLRIRNRGNAPATGIHIDFWYQKATPYLSSGAWTPVQNALFVTQSISGETLAAHGSPGDEKWVSVNWAPVDDGTHHPHYCVKAHITVAGDANSDNKTVLSNFGHVVVDPDGDNLLQLLRFPDGRLHHLVDVIPRGPRVTFGAPKVHGEPMREWTGWARTHLKVMQQAPVKVAFATFPVVFGDLKPWDERQRRLHPEKGRYYPVREDTLPPGVDPASLVTVAHRIEGHAVGGITYRVERGK
ncbi:MAG TPA: hypothetical protein VFH27_13145 [Longimicrobiaceae bacterium]|nr:hypothetical protein [Longimicrobiaceae bacterium]